VREHVGDLLLGNAMPVDVREACISIMVKAQLHLVAPIDW
jgi:hypothetical protein